jgi:stearoyl-CoA desaturase (delta-9 desaturase)
MSLINKLKSTIKGLPHLLLRWVDNQLTPEHTGPNQVDWGRILPFVGIHLACFGVIWVGVSAFACWFALFLYGLRIFAIGGFYHRYFSHKTFQTNRFWQFIFAILGMTAIQRGPLWWAAHHRDHHLHSDKPEDAHSPSQHGFWWSHMGWFTSKKYFHYNKTRIKDFSAFPELRFLDRFDVIVPIGFGIAIYGLGELINAYFPTLGTNGLQLFVWGFCISTVCVFHVTFTINSLLHCLGKKVYETGDTSRNNFLLALLTFGEGWHNNHHFYPACARQGFKWWQIDITYYLLLLLEKVRIIKNLRHPPLAVLNHKA